MEANIVQSFQYFSKYLPILDYTTILDTQLTGNHQLMMVFFKPESNR